MARKPRFTIPGVPQHVVQRGNNHNPCFYSTEDYQRYLKELQVAATTNEVAVHAYVLMTNHVHLLVTPAGIHGVSHMMQDIGRKYVAYINRSYGRSGTLWEGRFKACLVESEPYLLTCMRYIELNPVRAGMVRHPRDYRWSSYSRNALGQTDPLIQPHLLYQSLAENDIERMRVYRDLFRGHLEDKDVQSIRDNLNRELVLGRDRFKDRIEQKQSRAVRPGKPGRPRNKEA